MGRARAMWWRVTLIACYASLHALSAQADTHTLEECFEGGDFIANAARSRDRGTLEDAFMRKMEEDFDLIRSFPVQLRWFVRDPVDERFMLSEARIVFERPMLPDQHRAQFLHDCVEHLILS